MQIHRDLWTRAARATARTFVLGAGLALGGCAGLHGVQNQVTADDLNDPVLQVCPSATQIQAFLGTTDTDRNGLSREAYRNGIVDNCIAAADRKFADFTAALRMESTSTKLGLDLAALTLSGLGAAGNGARNAAAATTGLIGAGAAIDRDLYFDKTLPALVSAMNISRNQILAKIQAAEAQSADAYSLSSAAHDIWAYQNASNIDTAISQLTTTMGEKEAQTAGIELPSLTLSLVPPDVQARRAAMIGKIDALYKAGNRAALDQIAMALGIPADPDKSAGHTQLVYGQIKGKIFARSFNAADMNTLDSDLSHTLQ